jgi:FAD/FMN-containing dehydrogenase
MEIHGWGRYPAVDAEVCEPASVYSLKQTLLAQDPQRKLIARGSGRSYGDSALSSHIVSSRFLDNFISFNETTGEVSCDTGVTLDQILQISVPKGWFLPVLPGTKFVTVGGAIASDIHGKNHHVDGCFSAFVKSMTLMLGTGETIQCSKSKRKNLFRASCGGMGLTGIILNAKIQLTRIDSAFIQQESLVAKNLDEVFELFEENQDSKYSVAWLDSTAREKNLGRSILFLGKHVEDNKLNLRDSRPLSAPSRNPGFVLNRHSVRAMNSAYFNLHKLGKKNKILHYEKYFFPLDGIRHWNRLYGGNGFLQYQFVIPSQHAKAGIASILNECSKSGKGSFVTVLKKFGAQNENFLSFPLDGYTLTLDFKFEKPLLSLLDKLDEIVLSNEGRNYLAKDARMSESTFKQGYPNWQKFLKTCNQVDPQATFASSQSQRLGLVNKTEIKK